MAGPPHNTCSSIYILDIGRYTWCGGQGVNIHKVGSKGSVERLVDTRSQDSGIAPTFDSQPVRWYQEHLGVINFISTYLLVQHLCTRGRCGMLAMYNTESFCEALMRGIVEERKGSLQPSCSRLNSAMFSNIATQGHPRLSILCSIVYVGLKNYKLQPVNY